MTKLILSLMTVTFLMAVSGCSGVEKEAKYPTGERRTPDQGDIYTKQEGIFGPDGISFGTGDKDEEVQNGIGVNAYLWRATLDTVSFLPVASADPFGGVILTDWYSDEATPNRRYKLNVFITSKELRASALKVALFRQERVSEKGEWRDVAVSSEDSRKVEDAILNKARQLRIAEVKE